MVDVDEFNAAINAANEVIFEQVTQANKTLKEQLNAVQHQVTLQKQMQQQLFHQLQTMNESKIGNAAPKQNHQMPPMGQYQSPFIQQFPTMPPYIPQPMFCQPNEQHLTFNQ